jgi:hypothetical protein
MADRRERPATLRALLHWASRQFHAETPNLDHSAVIDDGGSPTMAAAVRRYLGLMGAPSERADDWEWIAGRQDPDGFYLTPLRRAIASFPRERRLFLRDLVPGQLTVAEVAAVHGIAEWAASDVAYRSLVTLWDRYLDRPLPERGWLTGRSDAQRTAEGAAVV